MQRQKIGAVGKVLVGFAFAAAIAMVPALEAKDKAEKKLPPPQAVEVGAGELQKAIFGSEDSPQAECTASCAGGGGWTCTGATVSCTDGVGCTGSTPGYGTARGECEAT